MKPSDITADIELAQILRTSVQVEGSAISVFADGSRPTEFNGDDFIDVVYNGQPEVITHDNKLGGGFILISLYCRLNQDGTIKKNRISKILEQMDTSLLHLAGTKYFYKLNLKTPVTPTTADWSSGYSVTRLNVKWRTKINNI